MSTGATRTHFDLRDDFPIQIQSGKRARAKQNAMFTLRHIHLRRRTQQNRIRPAYNERLGIIFVRDKRNAKCGLIEGRLRLGGRVVPIVANFFMDRDGHPVGRHFLEI